MVKRNISFYKVRNKLFSKHELWTKGRVHIIKFWDEKYFDIMGFWE